MSELQNTDGVNRASQVQHPWRATIRTGIATFLGVAAVLPMILTIVTDQLGYVIPNDVLAFLVAGVGLITAFASTLTRVMAIPQVDELLGRAGLGALPNSLPRHALDDNGED